MERNNLSIFFFQAEDGIRDGRVTGVQTCALPISLPETSARLLHPDRATDGGIRSLPADPRSRHVVHRLVGFLQEIALHRSEERRVEKECRSRWSPYH